MVWRVVIRWCVRLLHYWHIKSMQRRRRVQTSHRMNNMSSNNTCVCDSNAHQQREMYLISMLKQNGGHLSHGWLKDASAFMWGQPLVLRSNSHGIRQFKISIWCEHSLGAQELKAKPWLALPLSPRFFIRSIKQTNRKGVCEGNEY